MRQTRRRRGRRRCSLRRAAINSSTLLARVVARVRSRQALTLEGTRLGPRARRRAPRRTPSDCSRVTPRWPARTRSATVRARMKASASIVWKTTRPERYQTSTMELAATRQQPRLHPPRPLKDRTHDHTEAGRVAAITGPRPGSHQPRNHPGLASASRGQRCGAAPWGARIVKCARGRCGVLDDLDAAGR
jgi:hypothetical protein